MYDRTRRGSRASSWKPNGEAHPLQSLLGGAPTNHTPRVPGDPMDSRSPTPPRLTYRPASLLTVLAGTLTLSGCRAIAGIFRAGVWTGVLGIVLVLLLIGLLVRLLR